MKLKLIQLQQPDMISYSIDLWRYGGSCASIYCQKPAYHESWQWWHQFIIHICEILPRKIKFNVKIDSHDCLMMHSIYIKEWSKFQIQRKKVAVLIYILARYMRKLSTLRYWESTMTSAMELLFCPIFRFILPQINL